MPKPAKQSDKELNAKATKILRSRGMTKAAYLRDLQQRYKKLAMGNAAMTEEESKSFFDDLSGGL